MGRLAMILLGAVLGVALALGYLLSADALKLQEPASPPLEAPVYKEVVPPTPEDAGPGDLPADIATAVAQVYPAGRRVRCKDELGEDGPSSVGSTRDGAIHAIFADTGEPLRGVTWQAPWFAAAVPTEAGMALVSDPDGPLFQITWSGAGTGTWAACRVHPVSTYEIVGLVEDAEEARHVGARVGGCGTVATSEENGKFSVRAPVGRPCELVAVVEDDAGIGRSDPTLITSQGEDVLVELIVPPSRITEEQLAAGASRIAEVRRRALENGDRREREELSRRATNAGLGDDPIIKAWLQAVDERIGATEAEITALNSGDREAIIGSWFTPRGRP